ncbi:hypothetical protein GCM10008098_15510 [Rhodanobacter panaciterrae]|uniref:diguanylate cyclase n=1 Tax=Rhodanobacter panaciterrae TaxID=490572 RepID=A0ABQ2ZU94_9GAMM|nr:diguanylate cyclase [Rhodanobacter panaciterrae]GGY23014.1 hypothetical protein GCM10008098_15510 [Rhodanobacter panaciterrae]
MDSNELVPVDTAETNRVLAQLHALLPPGDARRERVYRALYCEMSFTNNARTGLAYASSALADAMHAADVHAQIDFHYCRGQYQALTTTSADALVDYNAGLLLARQVNDAERIGDGLSLRGSVESLQGEQALALVDLLEANRSYTSAGKHILAEGNLLDIAGAYRRLGEYDKARAYLEQSRAWAEQRHDNGSQLQVHMELGYLDDDSGNSGEAIQELKQALALAKQMSDRQSEATAQLGLAEVYNGQHEYQPALDALGQAGTAFASVSDQSSMAMMHLQYGIAHAGVGQHKVALTDYATAETGITADRNIRYLAQLYAARARSDYALGLLQATIEDLQRTINANAELDLMARRQETILMSYQFDTTRRDLENRRLAADAALSRTQIDSLEQVRRWQRLALLLGGVLTLLLAWLVMRQIQHLRRYKRMAMTDVLTGVANRRGIEKVLAEEVKRAHGAGHELSLLHLDVDDFKEINDSHGHQLGDWALLRIVAACKDALRQFDQLGRWGGDEFYVVLPNTGADGSVLVAERLRGNVEALNMDDICPQLRVSVSVGISRIRPGETSADAMIRRADVALYRAKHGGNNRVESEP